MDGLREAINEGVSLLKEQIDPNQKDIYDINFQTQIRTLTKTDPKRVAFLILQKKELESC